MPAHAPAVVQLMRRKGEQSAVRNERDLPLVVELPVPFGGFGGQLLAIHAFHVKRGLDARRGRGQRREDLDYARWCFASPEIARDFCEEFGGVLVARRGPSRLK